MQLSNVTLQISMNSLFILHIDQLLSIVYYCEQKKWERIQETSHLQQQTALQIHYVFTFITLQAKVLGFYVRGR